MLKKLIDFLNTKVMPPMNNLAEQRHIRAMREGIIACIPLLIIGSMFLVFAFPPIPALQPLVKPYVATLLMPFRLTMGLLSVYFCFSIGYNLSKHYKLDQLAGGLMATVGFFLLNMPTSVTDKGMMLPMGNLGTDGMVVAILISFFAVEVFNFCRKHNILIKMPAGVPEAVSRSFSALIPMAILVPVCWFARHVLQIDFFALIIEALKPLVSAGNSLPAILGFVTFHSILSYAGIHAASAETAIRPVWLMMLDQNAVAVTSGGAAPNIAPEPFYQWFVFIGGAGSTLALAFAALTSKESYIRNVGKAGIIPSICNINEPIFFGLPCMLNPLMFIPVVLAPLVGAIIAYFAITWGLVAAPYILAPWTLPGPIGAYISTGDWRAIVLNILIIGINFLIYYPFIKAYERRLLAEDGTPEK